MGKSLSVSLLNPKKYHGILMHVKIKKGQLS